MDDRHLPATQQRRRRLAAEGDVARSQELNSSIVFLALVSLAAAGITGAIQYFQQFVESVWNQSPSEFTDVEKLQATLAEVIVKIAMVFGSALLFCIVISLGMNYLQSRKIFLGRKPASPLTSIYQSFRKLFSFDSAFTFAISLFKIAALSGVLYFAIVPDLNSMFQYSKSMPMEWVSDASSLIFKASFATAACMLVFGLIDYGWQRRKYEQRILMTQEELQEEIREIQTDPQIAAQRRQLRNQ